MECFRDVRELCAGDRLLELERHVKTARAFLVPQGIGSKWVRRECQRAQQAEQEGYQIIALVWGLEPSVAELLLGEFSGPLGAIELGELRWYLRPLRASPPDPSPAGR